MHDGRERRINRLNGSLEADQRNTDKGWGRNRAEGSVLKSSGSCLNQDNHG